MIQHRLAVSSVWDPALFFVKRLCSLNRGSLSVVLERLEEREENAFCCDGFTQATNRRLGQNVCLRIQGKTSPNPLCGGVHQQASAVTHTGTLARLPMADTRARDESFARSLLVGI
uniref:Uncharacterized protein n=1 Tax=Mycena chlorophos TaxID=658473 RepID=A0ABQ0LDG5_MYCCL|nr:predicted protein [Mycena chlorophos]